MSNNQMVLAPRELLERLDLGKNTAAAMAALPELRELLAKPADQHQGEPVAWIDGVGNLYPSMESVEMYLPAGRAYRPLYTHADPSEVERLRDENRRLHEAGEFLDGVNQGIEDKLRAQVSEAHALLQAIRTGVLHDGWSVGCAIPGRIDAALCASAEPVAPAEVEWLREELSQLRDEDLKWQGLREQEREIDTLRSQLAERDALLQNMATEVREYAGHYPSDHAEYWQLHRLADEAQVLSASAEPSAPIKMQPLGQPFAQILADNADDLIFKSSAPVEHDERADFEADVNKRYPGTLLALSASKARPGQYANLYVQSAWDAWQARAALERKP